ncbi:hypothetical protein FQA39_LY19316 [Lamprigera yunnana]|nr:hypothetical protein FQA39_LY19316 [Lamprigera yunnana]
MMRQERGNAAGGDLRTRWWVCFDPLAEEIREALPLAGAQHAGSCCFAHNNSSMRCGDFVRGGHDPPAACVGVSGPCACPGSSWWSHRRGHGEASSNKMCQAPRRLVTARAGRLDRRSQYGFHFYPGWQDRTTHGPGWAWCISDELIRLTVNEGCEAVDGACHHPTPGAARMGMREEAAQRLRRPGDDVSESTQATRPGLCYEAFPARAWAGYCRQGKLNGIAARSARAQAQGPRWHLPVYTDSAGQLGASGNGQRRRFMQIAGGRKDALYWYARGATTSILRHYGGWSLPKGG